MMPLTNQVKFFFCLYLFCVIALLPLSIGLSADLLCFCLGLLGSLPLEIPVDFIRPLVKPEKLQLDLISIVLCEPSPASLPQADWRLVGKIMEHK